MIRFSDLYSNSWVRSLYGYFPSTVKKDNSEFKCVLSDRRQMTSEQDENVNKIKEFLTISTETSTIFEIGDIVEFMNSEYVVTSRDLGEGINYYVLSSEIPEHVGDEKFLP